jgi:hypothetical protein
MRSPIRACYDLQRRRLEAARAKGRAHVFWHYLSMGLGWSLFMVACGVLFDLYHAGAPNFESMRTRSLVYFVGGVSYGLVMWVVQETPDMCRRDPRR